MMPMSWAVRWRSWLRWMGTPYEFAARGRLWCYERGWCPTQRLPRPVISVGNLTLGGTGKTPVVIEVVQRLQARGFRVAVLSRGYRRTSQAPLLLVSDGQRLLAGPEEAGDEPYLIARRCPNALVAVGADRHKLGRWVLTHMPVDCFVLDDGFQHVQLHRDVNLLLVDAADLAGLQAALPIGRLREPLSAALRATAILITRVRGEGDASPVWDALQQACGSLPPPLLVRFSAEGVQPVGRDESRPLSMLRGRSAVVFSGVGNAESFHALVSGLGMTVAGTLVFPDHVRYTAAMVNLIRAKAKTCGADMWMTTEKDADKVAHFLEPHDDCWAVRLKTEILKGEDRLEQLLKLELPAPRAGDA
jgi:tetraacyldisaccharide 4'-kinase